MVGLVGVAVGIMWRGFKLIFRPDLPISDEVVALQSIAAGAVLLATLVLVGVTSWYSWLTSRLVQRSGPIVTAEVLTEYLNDYHDEFFTVIVRNSGNAAVSIDKVCVAGGAFRSYHSESYTGLKCPFQLLGNSSQKFHISWMWLDRDINKFRERFRSPNQIRAVVDLGPGRRVYSDWMKLHFGSNQEYGPKVLPLWRRLLPKKWR